LTCWKSTTFHSTPSRSRVMPFFSSFVVATAAGLLRAFHGMIIGVLLT
jgi:hypothetical protein